MKASGTFLRDFRAPLPHVQFMVAETPDKDTVAGWVEKGRPSWLITSG
jgi:hypothetical protein